MGKENYIMSATDFFRRAVKISKREKKNLTPAGGSPPPHKPPVDSGYFKEWDEDWDKDIDNKHTTPEEPINDVKPLKEEVEDKKNITLPEAPVNDVKSSKEGLEGERNAPPKTLVNKVERSGDGPEDKDSNFQREMYKSMRSKPR